MSPDPSKRSWLKTLNQNSTVAARAIAAERCLVEDVLFGLIPPARPVAIDKDDPAKYASVNDPRHNLAFKELRPRPHQQSVAQPIQTAHVGPPKFER